MQKAVILIVILFVIFSWRLTAGGQEQNRTYSNPDIWAELLQRAPYPYTVPLAPFQSTPIDGTYTKFEKKEGEPVHCLRCPDYAPEGGIWKLNLAKGVFRIFHRVTGWKDIGSFYISGDRLILANDPVCQEVIGVYRWRLEEGRLTLKEVDDPCAIHLRALNLTNLAWLPCRPPSVEAATTDHWLKPPGCDE